MRRDQRFKSIMLDARVLSRVIGVFVPELGRIGPEGILEMRRNGDIVPVNTELVSIKGSMSTDVVYSIRLPGGEKALLDIEGQLYRKPGDLDYNRALAYAARLLDGQRGSPEWADYGSLCKVYSAWVMLDPHADERNSVVRYRLKGELDTVDHIPEIPQLDKLEIVRIGIGDPSEAESQESYILDLLFWTGRWDEERELTLREVFKLSAKDDILLVDSRGVNMNLDEEFVEHWTSIGEARGEAIGEARGEAREKEKARVRMIEAYAFSVRRVMEDMGATLDSAMRIVPKDIAEDVRNLVAASSKRGSSQNVTIFRSFSITVGSSMALPISPRSSNGLSMTSLAALFFPIPGSASRAPSGILFMLNGYVMPVIERNPHSVTKMSYGFSISSL